jgi:hypothetical protein
MRQIMDKPRCEKLSERHAAKLGMIAFEIELFVGQIP